MQKGETYKIESLKGKWKNNCHALNRKVDCTQTEETGEYLDCQAEAHEWINSSLTDMNYWLLHKNTHLYTSTPEMFRVRCEESRTILFSKEYSMVKYSFGENIFIDPLHGRATLPYLPTLNWWVDFYILCHVRFLVSIWINDNNWIIILQWYKY